MDVLVALFLFQLHLVRRVTETAKLMVYPQGAHACMRVALQRHMA